MHGAHQAENAALALTAVEAFFGRPTPDDLVEEGLSELELPGRLEVVSRSPLLLLDGAHNPDGAEALAAALLSDFTPAEVCVYVVGQLDGRDPAAFVDALAPGPRDLVIATTTPGPRGLPATELAERIVHADREVEIVADVGEALERAAVLTDEHDRIVVTGSLHLVGEVRRRLGLD